MPFKHFATLVIWDYALPDGWELNNEHSNWPTNPVIDGLPYRLESKRYNDAVYALNIEAFKDLQTRKIDELAALANTLIGPEIEHLKVENAIMETQKAALEMHNQRLENENARMKEIIEMVRQVASSNWEDSQQQLNAILAQAQRIHWDNPTFATDTSATPETSELQFAIGDYVKMKHGIGKGDVRKVVEIGAFWSGRPALYLEEMLHCPVDFSQVEPIESDLLISGTIVNLKKNLVRELEYVASFTLMGAQVVYVTALPRTYEKYKQVLKEGTLIRAELKHDTSKYPTGHFLLVSIIETGAKHG
jgi:hypothetical protein